MIIHPLYSNKYWKSLHRCVYCEGCQVPFPETVARLIACIYSCLLSGFSRWDPVKTLPWLHSEAVSASNCKTNNYLACFFHLKIPTVVVCGKTADVLIRLLGFVAVWCSCPPSLWHHVQSMNRISGEKGKAILLVLCWITEHVCVIIG